MQDDVKSSFDLWHICLTVYRDAYIFSIAQSLKKVDALVILSGIKVVTNYLTFVLDPLI